MRKGGVSRVELDYKLCYNAQAFWIRNLNVPLKAMEGEKMV